MAGWKKLCKDLVAVVSLDGGFPYFRFSGEKEEEGALRFGRVRRGTCEGDFGREDRKDNGLELDAT